MNKALREISENCIDYLNSLPMVKHCELYGSLASGTEDELSDIDIKVDVSGCDNGSFMLEVTDLLKDKLNIIFYDYAPSLIPDQYIVSCAVSEENPFAFVDINCVATPHYTTVSRKRAVNNALTHTLKVWIANLKHYSRGADCYDDIVRMANRIGIEGVDSKVEAELLEDTLIWLEQNQTDELENYIISCREKFEELMW